MYQSVPGAPPLVGITTYGEDESGHFTLPRGYADAIRRAGGLPLLVTPGEMRIAEVVGALDALILTGGGDIDPRAYDGPGHETIYMIDEERDATEFALAKLALEIGFPTLGICRGTQLLNVALGGTLHAHLPEIVGEEIAHRLPPRSPVPHAVEIFPETRLAEILGVRETSPQSWHHQAIDVVAEGLVVTAQAPDGTVEAFEMPSHPWLVAVQWHPELTAGEDPIQQALFDALVAVARDEERSRRS